MHACLIFLLGLLGCTSDIGVSHVVEETIVEEVVIDETIGELGYEYGIAYEQAVDITFFVDTSGSMRDDQEELAAYMPVIYETLVGPTFTNLQWCVHMATTDASDGVLASVCWDDPDAYLKLMTMTSLLSITGYEEAGLDSAVSAIAWSGLYRKDADFLAIYISDEPDQSSMTSVAYEQIMDAAKEEPFIVTESAIILTGEDKEVLDYLGNVVCSDWPGNPNAGTGYLDVADIVVHLCDSGWDSVLDVVKDHVPGLNERWFLDDGVPYADADLGIMHEDSIRVWFDDVEIFSWYYDIQTNEVVLLDIPVIGTHVAIAYIIEPS